MTNSMGDDNIIDYDLLEKRMTILEKRNSLERLINGLGIQGVGTKMARTLAEKFGTMDNLMQTTIEEFDAVDTIGETLANNLATAASVRTGSTPFSLRTIESSNAAALPES